MAGQSRLRRLAGGLGQIIVVGLVLAWVFILGVFVGRGYFDRYVPAKPEATAPAPAVAAPEPAPVAEEPEPMLSPADQAAEAVQGAGAPKALPRLGEDDSYFLTPETLKNP